MPVSLTTLASAGRYGTVDHRLTSVATAGRYVVAAAPFVYEEIRIYSIEIDRPAFALAIDRPYSKISITRPSFTIVVHHLLE